MHCQPPVKYARLTAVIFAPESSYFPVRKSRRMAAKVAAEPAVNLVECTVFLDGQSGA
jgi:hypothetical protein